MLNKIKSSIANVTSTIKTIIIKRKVSAFSNAFIKTTSLYGKATSNLILNINGIAIAISRDIDKHPETYIRITDQLSKSLTIITDEIATLTTTIVSEKDNLKNTFQKIKEISQDMNVNTINTEKEANDILKSIKDIFNSLHD